MCETAGIPVSVALWPQASLDLAPMPPELTRSPPSSLMGRIEVRKTLLDEVVVFHFRILRRDLPEVVDTTGVGKVLNERKRRFNFVVAPNPPMASRPSLQAPYRPNTPPIDVEGIESRVAEDGRR